MRKILCLALLLVCISSICIAAPNDRYWWIRSDSKQSDWFDTRTIKYDKASDGKLDTNIIDVWIKSTYNEAGVNSVIEYRKKRNLPTNGFEELDYTLGHYKIDTQNNNSILLYMIMYSKNGDVLASYTPASPRWLPTIPGTIGETWITVISNYALKYPQVLRSRN